MAGSNIDAYVEVRKGEDKIDTEFYAHKAISIKEVNEEIQKQKEELERISLEMAGLSQSANEFIVKMKTMENELSAAKDEDLSIEKQKAPLEADLSSLRKEKAAIAEALSKSDEMLEKCLNNQKSSYLLWHINHSSNNIQKRFL